jgi:hypothetical protein
MKKQWEIPESNELRIGNYVYAESKEFNIAKVEQINSDRMHYFTQVSESEAPSRIYPSNVWKIPLTEEMLCRFTDEGCIAEHISEDEFVIDRFRLIWKNYGYWYVVDDMSEAYITKVKWVHEFQNMFFAINGKELTL